MKNTYITKFIFCLMLILTLNTISFATSIDTVPPRGELVIENAILKNGKYYTSEKELLLNITITDNRPITPNYQMLISNQPVTGETLANSVSWMPYTQKVNWTIEGDVGDTAKIYVYIKDEAGNISPNIVETTKKFTITYVAQGATNVPSSQTAICGVPFTTSSKEPKMANKYFMGWSLVNGATTESWVAEDVIEPKYISSDATLYAVWSDTPRKLSEAVEVGDFVDYPVQYANVNTNNGNNASNLIGWRVLDITDGVIKLISNGTPLAYKKDGTNTEAINELTTNFLNGTSANYESYGFTKSLSETFNNPYTQKVESIKASDVTKITGSTELNNLDISNYGGTLANLTYYYIAGEADSNNIYYVNGDLEIIESTTGQVYGIRPVVTLSSSVIATGKNVAGKWELKMPTVALTLNDGTSISTKTVTVGDKYGDLPTPTKTGYTFNGWYNEKNEQITSDTIVTEETKTLTAKWTVETYTVTFDPNGGTIEGVGSTSTTRTVTYGSTYGAATAGIPVATMVGYNFIGWFTAKTGGEQITETTTVGTSAKDLVLYARWEAIVVEPQAIAIFSETDGSLTFFKTSTIPEVGSTYDSKVVTAVYEAIETEEYYYDFENQDYYIPQWVNSGDRITSVEFKDKISPISTAGWFTGLINVTSVDLTNLDTSNVTDMGMMFAQSGITNLDLSLLNTSKVTNMSGMFIGIPDSNIDFSKLKTDNVTNMIAMFAMSGFSKLDLNSFNTEKVASMMVMFTNCENLTELNINQFNTSNVIDMLQMFDGCKKLKKLNLNGFNTSKVTNMNLMFRNCTELVSLDLSTFDMTRVISERDMYDMFANCIKLQEVKLGEKFGFAGTNGYLPVPSTSNITGADGNWYNVETGTAYTPSQIPNNTAAIYSALPRYTVTFNPTGGTIEDVGDTSATRIVAYGSTYGEAIAGFPTARKNGFKFVGWYTTPESGDKITEETVVTVTANGQTLYAYWEVSLGEAMAIYSETDYSLTFLRAETAPEIGSTYNDKLVSAVFEGIEYIPYEIVMKADDPTAIDSDNSIIPAWQDLSEYILLVEFKDKISPISTSGWFMGLMNVKKLDLRNLDTSNVTDMNHMFYMCYGLKKLDLSYFDTSKVTNMSYLFGDYASILGGALLGYTPALQELNISGWDTKNVTNMSFMFAGCSALTKLDVSHIDTSSATDMTGMFLGDSLLMEIDVSNFDTTNVQSLAGMFMSCVSVSKLNISNFKTQNCIAMSSMFAGCQSLSNIDLSSFDTTNVQAMDMMFSGTMLRTIDLSNFNTINVTTMSSMFEECSFLENIDLTNFDTTNLTDMSKMFNKCSGIDSLDLSNFDTTNVTTMTSMFGSCSSLEEVKLGEKFAFVGTDGYLPAPSGDGRDGTWYNTYTGVSYAPEAIPNNTAALYEATKPAVAIYSETDNSLTFTRVSSLPAVGSTYEGKTVTAVYTGIEKEEYYFYVDYEGQYSYIPDWTDFGDIITNIEIKDKITPISTAGWFSNFTKITSIDLTNLNISKVRDMGAMFAGCSALTELDITNLDTSNVTNMYATFAFCEALTRLDVTNFDTSKVKDMNTMFAGCTLLEELDVTNFNTSNVIFMDMMFALCSKLTQLDVTNFDTSRVEGIGMMFAGCTLLEKLDVTNFDTSNVTVMGATFAMCSSLTELDVTNFNTSNVTSMAQMFQDCSALTKIDLSNFDTSKITNMDGILTNCHKLQELKLGENFKFIGNSSFLPTPSSEYISGADGKWYNTKTLQGYEPNKIPSNTLATYVAVKPLTNAIAIFSETDNSLTFTRVNEIPTVGSTYNEKVVTAVYTGIEDENYYYIYNYSLQNENVAPSMNLPAWIMDGNATEVTKVEFLDRITPNSTAAWFGEMSNLTSIDLSKLDTTHVTNMSAMFIGVGVAELDLTTFDTRNVTDMGWMFSMCPNLSKINLSSFNTSKVTNMRFMFGSIEDTYANEVLTELDLTSFDTSNVTDMSYMFAYQTALPTIDLTKFDTRNVENMEGMFGGCASLTSFNGVEFVEEEDGEPLLLGDVNYDGVVTEDDAILIYEYTLGEAELTDEQKLIADVNRDELVNMADALAIAQNPGYYGYVALEDRINNLTFDTTNVTNMCAMFTSCTALISLDLSSFNTPNVTNLAFMFMGCTNLKVLNLSNLDTSSVIEIEDDYMTGMNGITALCWRLERITLGEKFGFVGSTATLIEQISNYIPGADGKWYNIDTGDSYEADAMPSYVNATYSSIPMYKVTFEANGGAIDDLGSAYTTRIEKYGTAYGSGDAGFPIADKRGYRFLGWYTEKEGGDLVTPETIVDTTASGLVLYAQWELLPTYVVTFDANGGTITKTGATTTTRIVTESYPYEDTVAGFPEAELSGYTFNGWFTATEGGTQITAETIVDNTADGLTLYAQWSESCFAEGTLITLADGTQKPIEEITYEDELLVWDFYNGRYTVSTASAIETGEVIDHEVITLCFSDDTEVRIIDKHGFYDEVENDFVFINEDNVSSYIGHNFIKLSDNNTYESVKLIDYYLTTEDVKFYTMLTAVHNNCIAEGMFTLTAEPMGLVGWYDTFEIGDNMKYDEKLMQETIEEYGLYTYEDFEEYVTYEQFMAFNGPYLKIVVGKGYITYEQILEVINRFANIMAQ